MIDALERLGGTTIAGALLRCAVVALVFAGSLSDQPLTQQDDAFPFVLGAAAVYAAASLTLVRIGKVPRGSVSGAIDLSLLAALIYTSGGAFSDVRFALFLFPVVAAAALSPLKTSRWAALAPAVYLIVVTIDSSSDIPGADEAAAAFSIYLAGVGVIAVGIATVLRTREERISALAEASRTLAARALEAEEGERRRLAYAIHDEPIQQLLSAQLELDRAARGDVEAAENARAAVKTTIGQLRETIFELYPSSLEQLGLGAAIEELANRGADECGAEISLEISAEATGVHDALVFTIARELLSNAVKHSEASEIALLLERNGGELLLRVSDNGRGMAPDRRTEALRDGHLGMAAATQRADSLGGSLSVDSAERQGTRVEVRLPLTPAPVPASTPGS